MPFNPVANFNQGLLSGQNIQKSQRENQIRGLQNVLSGQMGQGGFDPSSSVEMQQLTALAPEQGARSLAVFQNLDKSRQKAFFQDAREGRKLLEAKDGEGFLDLLSDRLENVEKLGGDPSDVQSVLQSFNSGDIEGTLSQLRMVEQTGINEGLLSDPLDRDIKQAKLDSLTGKYGNASNFAPTISGLQTDQDTGQQYVVSTNRNTQEARRIDIKGAKADTSDQEQQRLIRTALIKDAGAVSKKAFDSLRNIKKGLGTMSEALSALNKGANTGFIDRWMPSMTEATLELENAANRMGLDVISATTFGALSEGELRLAMDTALPKTMEPEALKGWVTNRMKAKRKMARELNKMAISLGKGNTTIAEYLERNAEFSSIDPVDVNTLSDDDLFK